MKRTTHQPDTSGWERVVALAAGTEISVAAKTGARLDGGFVHADTSAIVVRTAGVERTIGRAEVARIELRRRQTATKAARGAVVGALAGGAAGVLVTKSNRLAWGALLAAGWSAIGALIGAIDGRTDIVRTELYVSP